MSRRNGKSVRPHTVRALAALGLTDRQIGNQLGVHRLVIFYCRQEHGIVRGRQLASQPRAVVPAAERKARRAERILAACLDGRRFSDDPKAVADCGSPRLPVAPLQRSDIVSSLAFAAG